MIDLFFLKADINDVITFFLRGLFICISIIYIIYVLLQIRQIGIMNNALKTKASLPIAVLGIVHLILVVLIIIIVEILIW